MTCCLSPGPSGRGRVLPAGASGSRGPGQQAGPDEALHTPGHHLPPLAPRPRDVPLLLPEGTDLRHRAPRPPGPPGPQAPVLSPGLAGTASGWPSVSGAGFLRKGGTRSRCQAAINVFCRKPPGVPGLPLPWAASWRVSGDQAPSPGGRSAAAPHPRVWAVRTGSPGVPGQVPPDGQLWVVGFPGHPLPSLDPHRVSSPGSSLL